jgi:hypothetical protein
MSNKKSTSVEKSIYEAFEKEQNERSLELFNKPYIRLQIGEREKLDKYMNDLKNPIWKPIVIDGKTTRYEVSNTGEIRNIETGQIRISHETKFGYMKINLSIDGRSVTRKVHRLVAEAFIPNPDDKPEVNHIIPNKHLNWVGNLEWVTSAENKRHAIEHGLYDNARTSAAGRNSRYTDEQVHAVCKMLEQNKGPKEIAETIGVSQALPRAIKYMGKWRHISSQYNIPEAGSLPKRIPGSPRKSHRFSEETLRTVCELLEQGYSNSNISKITGVPPYIPYNIKQGKDWQYIAKDYNIPKPNKKSYGEIRDKVISLINDGITNSAEIIRLTGLPETRTSQKYIASIKYKLKK